MKQNLILAGIVVVLGLAIGGAYAYPRATEQVQQGQGSPAGTSFNTAKVASQQVTVGTTTTFSQLNSDVSDRTILGVDIMLRGATATSTTYTVACATSTTASSLQSNPNSILNTTLATSTFGSIIGVGTQVSSSSPGVTGTTTASVLASLANPTARNWAAGTYLNCQVTTVDNYNAFNSTTNGTISFPYRAQ